MPSHHVESISLATFRSALSRYSSIVPEKLEKLDTLRYDTIPAKVSARNGSTVLNKDEVEQLVEWKLKHGTFRPKLLSLVQSNATDLVQEVTVKAWKVAQSADSKSFSPIPALKILTELKGIGPATASLLLSVIRPDVIPFFSDELFRWTMWNEAGGPDGWKRGIKYNVKEYEEVVKRVKQLRERLGNEVTAVDAERVAWVLGKESVDVSADENDDVREERVEERADVLEKKKIAKSTEKEQADSTRVPPKKAKELSKQGTKRKATDLKVPTEGTRKSSRTRK